MEAIIIGAIMLFVMQYANNISANKFLKDNEQYFKILKEKDYDFYIRSRYGDSVDPDELFMVRVRNGVLAFVAFIFIFLTSLTFLNIIASIVIAYVVFKMQYTNIKKYYRKHLYEIDLMLPYYLKTLEVLIQHYTVPVALSRSITEAPEIFKPGLREMIEKIDAGDSTIDPYMEFAKEYPVRDSMRMMRLLYRLGLGAQENKQDQLLMFSRTVSALQNKSRELKYKSRLDNMERRTLYMLVVTGGGTMIILLLSMLMLFKV
jgi:hypothetical protein